MYLGADLSYINEIEDLGGVFYQDGHTKDPFQILKDYGANIVRVRLWHTPTWTNYSTFADVQRTIRRAKTLGMTILLDFHYSDTWADPAKQIIPAAWASLTDLAELEKAVYDYTYQVLLVLETEGLTPEFVQVGNEINTELMLDGPHAGQPINWRRNARLINAGIQAIRHASQVIKIQPSVMLHIAQPENVIAWFDDALAAGVHDFDVIGLSYYPKWSTYNLQQATQTIADTRTRYGKDVMVVETAYPWTLELGQADSHLIGADCLLPTYPATPQGQRQFLTDLTQATFDNGGSGVIYWEPAWISTAPKSSIWENATFFDYEGRVHEGIRFLSHAYWVTE
jgi:arabinogalactan endo-1,4-beta-galactosidase